MSETKKIGPALTIYHKSSTKLELQLRQSAANGANVYFELSDGNDDWVVQGEQVVALLEMYKAVNAARG